MFSNCKAILSIVSMRKKKKEHNCNELQQKLTPIYIRETNLISGWQESHCFNKKRITSRSFLTFRQVGGLFLFLGLGNRNFFGIMIFWVGVRNCIVKNEKCIIFPKS